MKKLAIFISHYRIDNSPSILNLLAYLSRYYEVSLYIRASVLGNSIFLNKLKIVDLSSNVQLVKTLISITYRRFWQKRFDFVICFDPHGFFLCSLILPFVRPVYYSLELYVKDDHFGLSYPWWVRINERNRINGIRGLIIQSREKDEIFRLEYGLPSGVPSFQLPVTYNGSSSSDKSRYLRTKFGINPNVKIALHLGGIAEWFSCIELAIAFSKIPAWALVFHGYPCHGYLLKLKETIESNKIENVYINDEQYDDLTQIDKIVCSCDLGVAWYNDISIGFRTAGFSSGKIPAYMRFGLPVVAKKYQSTLEAIEGCGAGLCVERTDDIAHAVNHIEENYEHYSLQARHTYDTTYNFEVYKKGLKAFLNMIEGMP